MSTQETGKEEIKEGESSESSIIVLSIEEEKEETILSTLSAIPPTITTKEITKEFDNYDIDIMSSDSYIKSIPTIKAGITPADFVVKEVALKSVLAIQSCSEFYSETKHASLPGKEDGGTTEDEKDAVKRHRIGISILTIACQNNIAIMSYVEESKDTE
jgi:hypothetical protein